ncbi:hypothetical protein ACF0H5_008119 [Mactra antiquata]
MWPSISRYLPWNLSHRGHSKLLSKSLEVLSKIMASNVHQTAKDGFKQGDHYDKSRPSYTDDLVSLVQKNIHYGKSEGISCDILELGAGTGKFTSKILPLLPQGTRYLATEPSEDFLSVLKDKFNNIDTKVCTATDIPLKDNSVQNVICAQCFHWFANMESLTEIHRVLAPRGRLLLVWNDKDVNIEWLSRMEDILTLYYGDTPRKNSGNWKNVFDGNDMFRCVEHTVQPGIHLKGNKDFVLNHYTSISVIAKLQGEERQGALSKFRDVLNDNFKNEEENIIIQFVSEFYCTEKV